MSPLLAEDEQLVGVPRAYIVVVEWDGVKDEGLIYATRLREAGGVPVELRFYQDAFHGCAAMVDLLSVSRAMHDDLIEFLARHL